MNLIWSTSETLTWHRITLVNVQTFTQIGPKTYILADKLFTKRVLYTPCTKPRIPKQDAKPKLQTQSPKPRTWNPKL